MEPRSWKYIIPFEEVDLRRVSDVGGKNASLGQMLRELRPAGVRVPTGFAVTSEAFRRHLDEAKLTDVIYPPLERLSPGDVSELARVGHAIRERVRSAPLPEDVAREVLEAYRELSRRYEQDSTDVAVRSSATAEDLPEASFAGQQETYLNVRGDKRLLRAVTDCMASLFTDRAIVYRAERGFDHKSVALSVGVQKMVRADLGAAGVAFTLDTETGYRDAIVITASYGLGETVVQGRVNPDEYWVHKPTLVQGYASVIRRECGEKAVKLVYGEGDSRELKEVRVSVADRRRFALSNDDVLELAWAALRIEEHYSAHAGRVVPMDIEWAKDGTDGRLYILQARPETVHSRAGPPKFEMFRLRSRGKPLLRGKSVGMSCSRRSSASSSTDSPSARTT